MNVPLMQSLRQRPRRVFLRQDPIKAIRHQRLHALKLRLAQRIEISRPVSVEVLAAPYSRLRARIHFAQTCDVNEQAVPYIDPACIDEVLPIAPDARNMVWVDIKQVIPGEFGPVWIDAGVGVHRHVQILPQPG